MRHSGTYEQFGYVSGTTTDLNRKAVNSYNTIEFYLKGIIPADVLPFSVSQALFESNYGNSSVARKDNNFSGITWINKTYQKNATKGSAKPKSEGGGYYAHFNRPSDWANDFVRILSVGKNQPIHANGLADYVNRLAANNYFKSSKTDYYNGLWNILKQIPGKKQDLEQLQNDTLTASAEYEAESWYEKLTTGEKVFGGVVLFGVVVAIIKR